eukprot:1154391-Pelagomonas_calceolata.AAC.1
MGLHKANLGAVGLNILSLGYAHMYQSIVYFVGAGIHTSVNPLVAEHGTSAVLGTNRRTLRRVMQADLKLQSKDDKCWTAQRLESNYQGLLRRTQ